ncbi:MAG TPA: hypothetical protein VFN61_08245 [Acidimicrobiales bacterium]|nr:hypothetical protein [Acidimicrobiales bacterium]
MRDYEIIFYEPVDPNPKYGLVPRHVRVLFQHCVEVTVHSRVRPDVWKRSLNDELLHVHSAGRDATGYVWGVGSQELYPGATVVEDSQRAKQWSGQIGIDFHEVKIEANAHSITLIFSKVASQEIGPGYAPYTVAPDGHGEHYAEGSRQPLA